MYELKEIGKVFTSKFVGTGPSSYKKRIYRAAVSQRLRNNAVDHKHTHSEYYSFTTATMVAPKRLKVTLYVHCASCYIFVNLLTAEARTCAG